MNPETCENYTEKYDENTLEYLELRKSKTCPLTFEDIDEDKAFKYYNKWNPITGEILDEDEHGPLYFDPVALYMFFLNNVMNHLLLNIEGGIYYNNETIGIGKDFNNGKRGSYKEKYVFRLPIDDCYCTEGFDNKIPTMGPVLNDAEIIHIDELINAYYYDNDDIKKNYKDSTKLYEIKRLYDIAIDDDPSFNDSAIPESIQSKFYQLFAIDDMIVDSYQLSKCAVNQLCKITGNYTPYG